MSGTPGSLIDSNVILDVVTEDPAWFAWSSEALTEAAESGPLFVNAVIYTEVSVRFSRIEDLEDVIPASDFGRLPIPVEAAFLAGKAFLRYRRRGGARASTLPDFFIGAHAAVLGLQLVTRDLSRYRDYFPTVTLITPGGLADRGTRAFHV